MLLRCDTVRTVNFSSCLVCFALLTATELVKRLSLLLMNVAQCKIYKSAAMSPSIKKQNKSYLALRISSGCSCVSRPFEGSESRRHDAHPRQS